MTPDDNVPILVRAKTATQSKSDYELSKYLGITTAAISGYKKRQSLPLEQCVKIAEQTGVSLDWLILGKGDMQPKTASNPVIDYEDADAAWIPLYDVQVSAGSGAEVFGENIAQYIPFARSWLYEEDLSAKDLVCVFVQGDSMNPILIHGDIAVVNTAFVDGDGVFVVRMGNALRVKRLQWLVDGSLRISSDNPAYEPETIGADELAEMENQFSIIGKCHTRIGRVF